VQQQQLSASPFAANAADRLPAPANPAPANPAPDTNLLTCKAAASAAAVCPTMQQLQRLFGMGPPASPESAGTAFLHMQAATGSADAASPPPPVDLPLCLPNALPPVAAAVEDEEAADAALERLLEQALLEAAATSSPSALTMAAWTGSATDDSCALPDNGAVRIDRAVKWPTTMPAVDSGPLPSHQLPVPLATLVTAPPAGQTAAQHHSSQHAYNLRLQQLQQEYVQLEHTLCELHAVVLSLL